MGKKNEIDVQAYEHLITKCTLEIYSRAPFLAVILIGMKAVYDDKIPFIMGTDGEHLFVNTNKLLLELSIADVKFILAHEAMHYVQKSHIRIAQYYRIKDRKYWSEAAAMLYNIASDLAINDILVTDGWKPPKLLPPAIPGRGSFNFLKRHMDTEYYFQKLMQKYQSENKKEKQGSGTPDSKESEEGNEGGSDKSKQEQDTGEGDGGGKEGEQDGSPKDRKDRGSKEKGKDKTPNSGPAEVDYQEIVRQLKEYKDYDLLPSKKGGDTETDINNKISMVLGKGCGGHQDSYLRTKVGGELLPPKIPWQRQLRMFLTAREHSKTSYVRPSRRRTSSTFIHPSRNNRTLGNVALVCDTSGSMTNLLPFLAAEIYSLVATFAKSMFWIIMADTEVRKEFEVGKGKALPAREDFAFEGLGGTELAPGIARASRLNADIIIIATDMEFSGWPEKPNKPVIWVVPEYIVEYRTNSGTLPPYGSVIGMNVETEIRH